VPARCDDLRRVHNGKRGRIFFFSPDDAQARFSIG